MNIASVPAFLAVAILAASGCSTFSNTRRTTTCCISDHKGKTIADAEDTIKKFLKLERENEAERISPKAHGYAEFLRERVPLIPARNGKPMVMAPRYVWYIKVARSCECHHHDLLTVKRRVSEYLCATTAGNN